MDDLTDDNEHGGDNNDDCDDDDDGRMECQEEARESPFLDMR